LNSSAVAISARLRDAFDFANLESISCHESAFRSKFLRRNVCPQTWDNIPLQKSCILDISKPLKDIITHLSFTKVSFIRKVLARNEFYESPFRQTFYGQLFVLELRNKTSPRIKNFSDSDVRNSCK
jgi:hypothetical protein